MRLPKIATSGPWFVDEHKRTVILRGVNLGGDSKVPFPNGGTQFPTDFSDHLDVSFIGRPFPLDEAKEHFERLKLWGFSVLRLLTTWEAVEHRGPGLYDEAYLEYFTEIVRLAGEYGFYVFIDFHQDVWSRMTGGDGAPAWIFEKIGMDYTKFAKADASIVMQHNYDYSKPGVRQEENYPTMCWSQNYRFSANGILWTLFFGGKDFAPNFKVNGKNIQDFLQEHYIGCLVEVAKRIKGMAHVLGFDTLNEPGRGFIGRAMNDRGLGNHPDDPSKPGLAWSPIDALYASHGYSVELPYLKLKLWKGGFFPQKTVQVNPDCISIWNVDAIGDPFQLEGAYTISKDGIPFIEKNDFFQVVRGQKVHFDRDYLIPFTHRVAESIRKVSNSWLLFVEREATDAFLDPKFHAPLPKQSVNAAHWYDLMTLLFKRFLWPITIDTLTKYPVFGRKGIRNMYVRQLKRIRDTALTNDTPIPSLVGEFGIPFDLENGKAYKEWKKGNHSNKIWKKHSLALSCMYDAMDELFLSNTLWNYTASNQNDLMVGDNWNQEDLSIFSKDQILPNSPIDGYGGGGRAIEGFVRPYVWFLQGIPQKMEFHHKTKIFHLEWASDSSILAPTVIKTPRFVYPNGFTVVCENCKKIAEKDGHIEVQAHGGMSSLRIIPND